LKEHERIYVGRAKITRMAPITVPMVFRTAAKCREKFQIRITKGMGDYESQKVQIIKFMI